MNSSEMKKLQELETFIQDLEREAYEVGAGLKNEANFSAIFDKMDSLISSDTVAEVRNSDIDPVEKGEYMSFLLCMIIDKNTKQHTDEVITKELEATIDIDGEHIPFRQLPILIANEQSHELRGKLDEIRRRLQEELLNPASAEIMQFTHEMAQSYGYDSYNDFFEQIEGVSLSDLRAETDRLLETTEDIYRRELAHYSETFLKIPARDLAQYDLSYMRRADLFDPMFPADKLIDSAWTTMSNMGIQAQEHPHVRLDVEKRDRKSPRAFCCPVRVPEEVYLVIMPHGGVDDYSSFLHELGHTLHYAHTNDSLPLAARHLGDNSVTEAHASTLENLIVNSLWLERRLGVSDAGDYLRFMNFFELYMLRRYCGKLQYEMELHGGKHSIADCRDIYAETLTRATAVQYDPAFYLSDVDNHFYCARYLRAWMLERQIRAKLIEKHDLDWFDKPEAGNLLLQMWAQGQKFKAEAISQALGFDSLNFDFIIDGYSG